MSSFETLAKAAFPPMPASAELIQKLRTLAIESDRKKAQKLIWRRRIRLTSLTAGVAGLAIGGVVLRPKIAFAYTLYRVESALKDQAVSTYRTWIIEADGSKTPGYSISTRGQEVRIDRGRETLLYTNHQRWIYQAGSGIATFEPSPDNALDRMKVTTGSALLREISSFGWLSPMDVEEENGQIVASVIGKSERTRLRLWIDEDTDLPLRTEIQSPSRGGWKTEEVGEFGFGTSVDAGLFKPNFPSGTRVVDKGAMERELRSRWSTPLMSVQENGDGMDIRDVQVNAEGDVFVLFTSRRVGGEVQVAGANGEAYLSAEPFDGSQEWTSGRVDGFTFPGGRLRGALFVPAEPSTWRPKAITIIAAPESTQAMIPASAGHKVIIHGKEYIGWSASEIEAYRKQHGGSPADVAKRTLTMRFETPNCEVLPAYMDFLPQGIQSETDLARREAKARGDWDKDHGLYAQAETEIHNAIDLTTRFYRETGNVGVQPEEYFELYEILAAEGKRAEALKYLKAVPDQMVYRNDGLQSRYEEAVRKEGLNP